MSQKGAKRAAKKQRRAARGGKGAQQRARANGTTFQSEGRAEGFMDLMDDAKDESWRSLPTTIPTAPVVPK